MRKQGLAGHSNTRKIVVKSSGLRVLSPSYVRPYGLIQLATIAIENAWYTKVQAKLKALEGR